ncbi:hypothetical protein DBR06_SOUSAS26110004, partial [Sousa chinensis]
PFTCAEGDKDFPNSSGLLKHKVTCGVSWWGGEPHRNTSWEEAFHTGQKHYKCND